MGDPITQTLGFGLVKQVGKALTPKIPDVPKMDSASVQRAAMEEAQKRKAAKGWQSTVLGSFMPQSGGGLKQTLGE